MQTHSELNVWIRGKRQPLYPTLAPGSVLSGLIYLVRGQELQFSFLDEVAVFLDFQYVNKFMHCCSDFHFRNFLVLDLPQLNSVNIQ